MNYRIAIATEQGIHIAERAENKWQITHSALIQHKFTSVACKDQAILAGATDGLYLSLNQGQSWRLVPDELADAHLRSVSFHPNNSGQAFAGTEPAALFYSNDNGLSWQECAEVAHMRKRYDWYLPYSPHAGCVRDFALQGERGYAAVEQGGLLRSDNGGQSWYLLNKPENGGRVAAVQTWLHPDVHSVQVHPNSEEQVLAATGGGLFYSTAGGRAWSQLQDRYCRAFWVNPQRPDHLIVGSADGPDRNGRIEVSHNGGSTWELAMDGQPLEWMETMVEQFMQVDDQLLAVLSNGELLSAALDELAWQSRFPASQGLHAIAALEA